MSEKPKMYHSTIDKVFHNNKVIYMSSDKNKNFTVDNIRKKIDDIINDSSFIYRTKVNIVLDDEIISKKIIGVINNNLVTIDNEYISIDSIKDIYK